MNFLTDVNFIIAVAAFFVGLLLMGVIAIVAVYFFTKQSRENFHKNMERSTDFILAKLGLETANVDLDAEKVRVDVAKTTQARETVRETAMSKFYDAEQARLQAITAQWRSEQQYADVLDVEEENAKKRIKARKDLLSAGINPDAPPPKGWWERNQFLAIFILGLIFIAIVFVLHIIKVI